MYISAYIHVLVYVRVSLEWSHRRRRTNSHTYREIVNLKARHGHSAQGRFLRGFRSSSNSSSGSSYSEPVGNICWLGLSWSAAPVRLLPCALISDRGWFRLSHSQVPEVARVVARRIQRSASNSSILRQMAIYLCLPHVYCTSSGALVSVETRHMLKYTQYAVICSCCFGPWNP